MPGSQTTQGRPDTRADVSGHVAFRDTYGVGTPRFITFAAQWLACTIPCRRFADTLAGDRARLGANVDRYSFIATDFHRLLLAGLPAHKRLIVFNELACRGSAAPRDYAVNSCLGIRPISLSTTISSKSATRRSTIWGWKANCKWPAFIVSISLRIRSPGRWEFHQPLSLSDVASAARSTCRANPCRRGRHRANIQPKYPHAARWDSWDDGGYARLSP
jgi:hypothetical protein